MTSLLKRYLRNRDGNFAVLTALLTVPLVMGVGLMLDIATIAQRQTELQQVIDAAALAIAREGTDLTDEKALKIARDFLDAHLSAGYTNLRVIHDGNRFTVIAEATAGISFGAVFGITDWRIEGATTAELAYADYEMALVLDTTGSMAGGKLQAMKDAVTGMIESMSKQVTNPEKLKFGLVPFAAFVNVGPRHGPDFDRDGRQIPGTGAAWLDLKGATPVPQTELVTGLSRFQLYRNIGVDWPGCVEMRVPSDAYDTSDAEPDTDVAKSLVVPAFAIDEPDSWGYSNNYISSDVDPFDRSVAAVRRKLGKYGVETDASGRPLNGGVGTVATISRLGGKGPGRGCDVQPLTPLSNDYRGLINKVKALRASGTTNILGGVTWGNKVLSPAAPFTEGKDPKKQPVQKVMVVLTDGSNVMGVNRTTFGSSYSSLGYLSDGRLGISSGTDSQTNHAMNVKTLEACTAAKNAGMTVYTIRLEEPDAKTGMMLKDCATSPDHFFDAPSRSQLDDIFSEIRDRVMLVRIVS